MQERLFKGDNRIGKDEKVWPGTQLFDWIGGVGLAVIEVCSHG